MTTSWTQADIDALEAEIKSLNQRVRFGDREVQKATMDEKLKLLQVMKDAVAQASPSTATSRTSYGYFKRSRNRNIFGDE